MIFYETCGLSNCCCYMLPLSINRPWITSNRRFCMHFRGSEVALYLYRVWFDTMILMSFHESSLLAPISCRWRYSKNRRFAHQISYIRPPQIANFTQTNHWIWKLKCNFIIPKLKAFEIKVSLFFVCGP